MTVAKLSIDLTNYKSNGDYVKPGTYEVIVDDIETTKTKAGDPMLNVWFVIQKGDEEGRTVMDRFPIMDKALWRVVKFLNAVGLKTPRKNVTIDTARIVNRRLVITVVDGKPYNNRIRSEVDDYFPAKKSAAPAAPADVEDVEEGLAVPEESVSTADVPAEPDADEVADAGDAAEQAAEAEEPEAEEPEDATSKDAGKPETEDVDEDEDEDEDDADLDDLEDLEL